MILALCLVWKVLEENFSSSAFSLVCSSSEKKMRKTLLVRGGCGFSWKAGFPRLTLSLVLVLEQGSLVFLPYFFFSSWAVGALLGVRRRGDGCWPPVINQADWAISQPGLQLIGSWELPSEMTGGKNSFPVPEFLRRMGWRMDQSWARSWKWRKGKENGLWGC